MLVSRHHSDGARGLTTRSGCHIVPGPNGRPASCARNRVARARLLSAQPLLSRDQMLRQKCFVRGLSVLLPLFAAGCGGHATHDSTGATGSSGGSIAATGGATSESGTGGTTADGTAVGGRPGTLVLVASGGPSGGVSTGVPSFEPGVGAQQTCDAPVNAGACQLTSCKVGGIGLPGRGYGNFGPISATVGTTTVALTYDRSGYATVSFPPSVTLGTGGTMKFHGGNGADVPVFDVAATIPGLGVITSPRPTSDGDAAVIDTSEDLSVTWLPIPVGQIHFHINGGDWPDGESQITVSCTFEVDAGAGVVPHALLSSLKQMSAAAPTYAGLGSELDATTVVDGLTITTWSFQNSTPTNRDFKVTLQ